MAFDESKDEIVDSVEAVTGERTRILVQIARYNGGAKKLQLKRETRTKDGWSFAKLGRMDPREFTDLVPVALELLQKHNLMEGA